MCLTLIAPLVLIGQLSASPSNGMAGASCARCGADVSAIARTLAQLESDPHNLARFWAVLAVRHYDIHCHSEIVPVLLKVLRHDRDDAIRAEAAISLSRLGANGPAVVEALGQAAAHDQLSVRLRANWALRSIARHS